MSNSSPTATSRGGSVLGWLTIILIILKVNPGGHLDSVVQSWSWWLVLLPLWGGAALLAVILIVFLVGVFVISLFDKR